MKTLSAEVKKLSDLNNKLEAKRAQIFKLNFDLQNKPMLRSEKSKHYNEVAMLENECILILEQLNSHAKTILILTNQ